MLKLFALMLMTFMMVSCGGGKSTATLSITRGMLLANTSFSGGIYITGEKVGGTETFSATITSGNQTSVTIPFGNWNFKVIGWDGGGVMGGTAYCKYLPNYAFTTEGQQLEITTTASECFIANISGGNQQVTANVGPWKNLVLNTCGSLANPSATNNLTVLGYFNPCTQGNYDIEYRKTHPYYKVVLVNQTIGGIRTAGTSSACLAANTPNTVLFPNRMPVTVKFYEDSGCSKELDEFRFIKGLDWSLSPTRASNDFDWQVTADTVNFFVSIANGASKRGTTAFNTEVPTFKCMESGNLVPCTKYPSTSNGIYYIDPDSYSVIVTSQTTCEAVTFTGIVATSSSCEVINGKTYIGFRHNGWNTTSGTMSMNGNSYTIKVGNTDPSFPDDHIHDAYKTMKRAMGFRNPGPFDDSLQDDADEGDNLQMGFLDPAIYEIGSMGAGGTFYDHYAQCTTGALPQVSRSYVKKGFSYTVLLSGISGTTPGFTARSDEPEFMGSEVHYNRRLIVRKLVGPILETEKIIDFSCDNFNTDPITYVTNSSQVRNGKLEEQRTYTNGSSNNIVYLKKIIFWNTSSSDTARFDVYRSKRVTNSTGTPKKIERNFYRVTKSDSDTINDFKIHSMNYEAIRDASSFDESIWVNEIDGKVVAGSTVDYSHKRLMDLKLENTTVGNIFSTTFGAELNRVRYGFRPSDYLVEQTKVASSADNFIEARRGTSNFEVRYTDLGTVQSQTLGGVADNIAADISPNGLYMIAATNTGNTISFFINNNGTTNTGTITASGLPKDIKVAILDNGTYVIAHIDVATSPTLYWNLNGTNYSSPFNGTYNHQILELAKDSTMIYLLHTRANALNTLQSLDVCKLNGSTSCGFNTVASRVSSTPFSYASMIPDGSNLYLSYIQDTYNTLYVDTPTLLSTSAQLQPTGYKFTPFQYNLYTNLSSDTALRSITGTPIDVHYPFYNSTISGFQIKPVYLKQSIYDSLFTAGFASQTN